MDECKSGRLLTRPVGGLMGVSLDLILVFQDLPIELIGQTVDGRIEIIGRRLAMQVFTTHVHRHLRVLLELFHGELDLNVDQVVEMAKHTRQLSNHVIVDCWCDLKVMPRDIQVHKPLLVGVLERTTLPDWRDLEDVPIFRNRAPSHHDTVFAHLLREFTVG